MPASTEDIPKSSLDLQTSNDLRGSTSLYSLEEISKHNYEHDCWVTVNDGVYDVTSFVKLHPGGKVIVGYAGGDATVPYTMTHKSAYALQTLKKYRIGTIANYQPSAVTEGFKKLTDEFKKKGYFNCSKAFLIFQFVQITLISMIAYWIYCNVPGFLGVTLATLTAALAEGQAGWFMHDLGHFSIFRSMFWNRTVQYLVMNIYLGGSHTYWRNAHWKHHLFTNIEGWDHDLDTLPLFAWSRRMFARMPSKAFGALQEYYWYIIGPATSFWYIYLLSYIFYIKRKNYISEGIGNAIHWTAMYFIVGQSITATILGQMYILLFLGLYMGHIFSLNHFPMEINDKTDKKAPTPTQLRKITGNDLVSHQLKTTRNVESSTLINWFTGHLNFQIEHHVWPMMPRHNLPIVAPIFEQFCKEHNLPYQKVGFVQAFCDVFTTLKMVHVPEKTVE